jgi:uncharacterized protein YwqG
MTFFATLPAIILSRRPRHLGDDRSRAKSWLGGAPRLGGEPWPRSKDGRPLHFMAQVDLGEIAAAGGSSELPTDGALAFFIGADAPRGCKVIHIPPGRDPGVTPPPADLPDFEELGGDPDYRGDSLGRRLFPFWPIDFTVIEVPTEGDHGETVEVQHTAIGGRFRRREYNLSASAAFEGPPIPRWWQHAIHYVTFLTEKLRSVPDVIQNERRMIAYTEGKLEEARAKDPAEIKKAEASVAISRKRLAERERQQAPFEAYVAEVAQWASLRQPSLRQPWALMSDEDWVELEIRWGRRLAFPDFTGFRGESGMRTLQDMMFKALPAIDSEDFTALPEDVRKLIRARRAPRPLWWFAALEFAAHLREAEANRVPRLTTELQSKIDAERAKLRRLRPGGALADLWTKVLGKSKDVSDLEAKIGKMEDELAEHVRRVESFSRFVGETAACVQHRDPWAFMPPEDIDRLAGAYRQAQDDKGFHKLAGWRMPHSLEAMEAVTLRTLAAADDDAYATLPENARRVINETYMLPIGPCHQMFGVPADIQGNAEIEEDGNRLLLQLGYDDMMFWSFGDNGVYQFWIKRDDLAARNWDAVKLTFECH